MFPKSCENSSPFFVLNFVLRNGTLWRRKSTTAHVSPWHNSFALQIDIQYVYYRYLSAKRKKRMDENIIKSTHVFDRFYLAKTNVCLL